MHRYLLHNDEIRDTSAPLLAPGQVGFLNGWGVFSTLRVAGGVLFAFERHYARLERDAARMHVPFPFTPAAFEAALLSLVSANAASEATLRVAVVRNRGGLFEAPHQTREADLIAFTADLNDWGSGAKLGFVANARFGASPFAGRKVTSWAENLAMYEEAHERGFDEVVLLNEAGQVSECTSANIFAVYGGEVYTPPLETSGCLPGITRALLLEEIDVPGIKLKEQDLVPSDLEMADQVFITSSTRDLFPALEIEHQPLKQKGQVLAELKAAFAAYRAHYVTGHATNQAHPEIVAV